MLPPNGLMVYRPKKQKLQDLNTPMYLHIENDVPPNHYFTGVMGHVSGKWNYV